MRPTAPALLALVLLTVSNTARGEFPVVDFSVTDPTNGDAPYDIHNDPDFFQFSPRKYTGTHINKP